MATKIEKLEIKLSELTSNANKEEFEQWVNSAFTKALLLQLEIDREELKENWVQNLYNPQEEERAKGQAQYIDGLGLIVKGGFND